MLNAGCRSSQGEPFRFAVGAMQIQGTWLKQRLFRVIPRRDQATRGTLRVSEAVRRDVVRRVEDCDSKGLYAVE